jgi:hypothetical protein
MDRVSGDLYQVYTILWKGRTLKWRVYRESWIVDNPKVKWSRCSVGITGNVRYWKGGHLLTNVEIVIPWHGRKIGPATVKFTYGFSGKSTYSCKKQSNAFRDVTLEVDVCDSVNNPPILPSYNTHAHPDRPVDLPERNLTIKKRI